MENGYDRTPVRAFVSMQDGWRQTVAGLGELRAPIRLYKSRVDHVVDDLDHRAPAQDGHEDDH